MYDAIVAGLGGMGSAAAYRLAGRGKRVLGLERHAPVHDRGSSHGESRIIRQAYFEDPAYVPLLLRAYELWERLERETGEELMTLGGGLMIGPPDGALVSRSVASADEHGLPYEILTAPELKRRYPIFEPGPNVVALYEKRAGFVRPEAGVKAHLDRAASMGAELRFEERVTSWEATSSGVRVETERGSYEAERLVVPAGAWAGELLGGLGLPLEVTRQILFWFRPEGGVEAYAPERVPIWIYEPDDGNMFYSFPAVDGEQSVKAAFFRAGGKPADPETIDREVHDEEVEFIRGYLARHVPSMNGDLVAAKTWTAKSAAALAEHAASLGMEAAVVARPEDAIGEATLLVTATTGREPVLPEGVRDDAFVAAVGSFEPEAAELPPALISRSTVVVDTMEGAREEAGDLLQAESAGAFRWESAAALEDALRWPERPGGPVVFESVGHALWDLAAARTAFSG